MSILPQILEKKIVAILRGVDPDYVMHIASALQEGGIRLLEITLNSPRALSLIEKLSEKMGDQLLIGAGTVLDEGSARAAIAHGARFIISPALDIATIEITLQLGAVSIPGAFTPTEILTAFQHGGQIIKVFPASSAGYIREIRAPLSQIPLMPTGGINLENIGEFKKAGAVAFGIGSSLVAPGEKITDNYLQELAEKAKKYVQGIL